MSKRFKLHVSRYVSRNISVRSTLAVVAVLLLLQTAKYGLDYFKNLKRLYVKIQNLDISGDFPCKSSIKNDSCTIYASPMNGMSLCLSYGEKCKAFTFNIGPTTVTFKSQVVGKSTFTIGITTFLKNKYKGLLKIEDIQTCATELKTEKKDSKTLNKICNLPEIDPFDPTIMKMIEKVPPIVCKGEKNLTFYHNGKLMITPEALSKVKKVQYQVIHGKSNSGQGYDIHKRGTLTVSQPAVTLNEDMVYVKIHKRDGATQQEFHSEVIPREELLKRVSETKPGIPLNVMMVGLDSTSHAHFQRKLGSVYKYMKEELKSNIFNGYSVVGEGTTVAVTALLVGRFFEELRPEGRKGYKGATCVDSWPWIFNDMKKHGYVTFHDEDQVNNGAITTRLKGFCKPPADHYMLPLWYSALNKLTPMYDQLISGIKYIQGHCLGSEAIYNVSLSSIERFFSAYPNSPKFGFQMSADFSHQEDFNFISLVEDRLLDFLKHMKEKNYLNNTILIVFGDHGLRYGVVRSTILGRMEARLPFLSMTFPPWFKSSYPELVKNLEKNLDVLTTPFDVHATLLHLLSYPKKPEGLPHGKSLLTGIGQRTCAQAGVSFHHCSCLNWKAVRIDNEDIQNSGSAVVDMINDRLVKNGLEKKCAKLQLKRVVSAIVVSSQGDEDEDLHSQRFHSMNKILKGGCMYQLKLETTPNTGTYEATVQVLSGIPKVNSHLSRIDEYGNQADCIYATHPLLREICYCTKT